MICAIECAEVGGGCDGDAVVLSGDFVAVVSVGGAAAGLDSDLGYVGEHVGGGEFLMCELKSGGQTFFVECDIAHGL